MKVMILIAKLCLFQPEMAFLCKERVTACYEKHREISELTDREIVKLCYGTYRESQGE